MYFQEILLNINNQISQLKAEIIILKKESSKNKKKIKNLEECVKILDKLINNAR